jgi:1-acyl-sn-glycerol-3-phosphate acyltransferase
MQKTKLNFLDILKTLYTWSVVLVFTVFFSLLVHILFFLTYLFDKKRDILHFTSVYWAKTILFLCPWWRFQVLGKENLPESEEAVVYIANHSSMADILAAFFLGVSFRWMAKSSLFKIPFLGWGMGLVGYIPVNRKSFTSRKKCMKTADKYIKSGKSMFFFPEGTRSLRSKELNSFKPGAFQLARENSVSIVPITIKGCDKLLPKGSYVPQKTNVQIIVHEKISSEGLSLEELSNKCRSVILASL